MSERSTPDMMEEATERLLLAHSTCSSPMAPCSTMEAFVDDLPVYSPVRKVINHAAVAASPLCVVNKGPALTAAATAMATTAGSNGRDREVLHFATVGLDLKTSGDCCELTWSRSSTQVRNAKLLGVCSGTTAGGMTNTSTSASTTPGGTGELNGLLESIADYCFPDGIPVSLEVTDRGAQGSEGSAPADSPPSVHILQFSDASGTPTYACCMVVAERVEVPPGPFVDSLLAHRERTAAAARTIQRALCLAMYRHKRALEMAKRARRSVGARLMSSFSTPFKFGTSAASTTAKKATFATQSLATVSSAIPEQESARSEVGDDLGKARGEATGEEKREVVNGLGSVFFSRLKKTFASTTKKARPGGVTFEETTAVQGTSSSSFLDTWLSPEGKYVLGKGSRDEQDREEVCEDEGERGAGERVGERGEGEDITPLAMCARSIRGGATPATQSAPTPPHIANTPPSETPSETPSKTPSKTPSVTPSAWVTVVSGGGGVILSPVGGGSHCAAGVVPRVGVPSSGAVSGVVGGATDSATDSVAKSVTESVTESVSVADSVVSPSSLISSVSRSEESGGKRRARKPKHSTKFLEDLHLNGFSSEEESASAGGAGVEGRSLRRNRGETDRVGGARGAGGREGVSEVDEYVNMVARAAGLSVCTTDEEEKDEEKVEEKDEEKKEQKLEEKRMVKHGGKFEAAVADADSRPSIEVSYVVVTCTAYCVLSTRATYPALFAALQSFAGSQRKHATVSRAMPPRPDLITTATTAATATAAAANTSAAAATAATVSTTVTATTASTTTAVTPTVTATITPTVTPDLSTSLDEWACAVLFTLLPPSVVVHLLSLLLLEQSLIVCGPLSGPGLVSTVTTAVSRLLRPFAWAGILVPILPDNARQVMEAPVPFIVGTLKTPVEGEFTPSAAVLHLDDFQEGEEVGSDEGFERGSESGVGGGAGVGVGVWAEVGGGTGGVGTGRGVGGRAGGRAGLNAGSRGLFARDMGLTDVDTDVFVTRPVPTHPTDADAPLATSWYSYSKNDPQATGEGNNLRGKGDAWQEKKYLRLPLGGAGEVEGGREGGEGRVAPHPAAGPLVEYLRQIRRLLHKAIAPAPAPSQPPSHPPSHPPSRPPPPPPSGLLTPTAADSYLLRAISGHLTPTERRLVRTAVTAIHRLNTHLCGDLPTRPAAWQRYGRNNNSTGEFDFYPEMFLSPRRAELAFQERLVHTQLFCSFLDSQRGEFECRTRGDGVGEGRLIRDWLRFRVHMWRKRMRGRGPGLRG